MKLFGKRYLYLAHRWFGVAMCAFVMLWFLTGIIMMYVEYPELTEPERLAALEPLDFSAISYSPDRAIAGSALRDSVQSLRLGMIAGRPAYILLGKGGEKDVAYADDGSRPDLLDPELAVETVRRSGLSGPGAMPAYDSLIEVDQWTVSEVLDEHRPLHRVSVGDDVGKVLYVSSQTGRVVRDTDRSERLWNWLGSTIHWIYPFQLRRHQDLWTNLLVYLSLAAVLAVVSGGIVGILRLRPLRRYRGTDMSPFRGIAWWHHVLGLTFFVFVATFTFSGLMSMAPWGLFDSDSSLDEQIDRYEGGAMTAARVAQLGMPPEHEQVREIEWRQVGGSVHAVLSRSAEQRTLVLDDGPSSDPWQVLLRRVRSATSRLIPEHRLIVATVLTEHDDYYYSRHNRYRPLPILRAEFDDPEQSWFDIDLATGAVVQRQTTRSRVLRWLYNGLHSLDFAFLTKRGLLWDVTVISLCVLGSLFAMTAVVVGWRRLKRGM